MSELWQKYLIRNVVVNTGGVGEKERREAYLDKFVFWVHLVLAGFEGGVFPLRLSSRVWRQAAGGTGYQFMCALILRRAFWPPRKRIEGYEGETLFPQYVIQIILIIRNVISFE